MNAVFSAKNLIKEYSRSNFKLDVEQIELYPGTITGVVGENGNGKTTLLNIIAGELAADGDLKYSDHSDSWMERKNSIAFIPQRIPRWFGTLYQNLTLKAAIEGVDSDGIDPYLTGILDFLNLSQYKDLKWSEISTGYRLRFELAKALIGKPSILVLDEPIANLDINTQQKFLSDLKKILTFRDEPVAVILSSQQLHEIETIADHMIFLRSGKSVFSGNVSQLSENQNHDVVELQVADTVAFELYLTEHQLLFSKRGEYFQVELGKEVGVNQFIKTVIEKSFEIKYFRNISNSTKRLFS
ncbi:ABC transporter ATP-binding protein [bacterium]|nr:ABC transporter ATP-binding protein [bacterium]